MVVQGLFLTNLRVDVVPQNCVLRRGLLLPPNATAIVESPARAVGAGAAGAAASLRRCLLVGYRGVVRGRVLTGSAPQFYRHHGGGTSPTSDRAARSARAAIRYRRPAVVRAVEQGHAALEQVVR